MGRTTCLNILYFACALAVSPSLASGSIYGNPAPEFESGAIALGILVSDMKIAVSEDIHLDTAGGSLDVQFFEDEEFLREKFFIRYAFTERIMAEFAYGEVRIQTGTSVLSDDDLVGREISGSYRHQFTSEFEDIRTGFIINYATGELSNDYWNGSYSEFQIGFGMLNRQTATTSIYGTLLYDRFNAQFDLTEKWLSKISTFLGTVVSRYTVTVEKDLWLGAIAGMETLLTDNLALNVEMHFRYASGYTASLYYRF